MLMILLGAFLFSGGGSDKFLDRYLDNILAVSVEQVKGDEPRKKKLEKVIEARVEKAREAYDKVKKSREAFWDTDSDYKATLDDYEGRIVKLQDNWSTFFVTLLDVRFEVRNHLLPGEWEKAAEKLANPE